MRRTLSIAVVASRLIATVVDVVAAGVQVDRNQKSFLLRCARQRHRHRHRRADRDEEFYRGTAAAVTPTSSFKNVERSNDREEIFLEIVCLRLIEQHTVDVSGQHYAVQVYQLADNVWIADGKFRGDQLRTSGSTLGKAVSAWRRAAVKRPADKPTVSVIQPLSVQAEEMAQTDRVPCPARRLV